MRSSSALGGSWKSSLGTLCPDLGKTFWTLTLELIMNEHPEVKLQVLGCRSLDQIYWSEAHMDLGVSVSIFAVMEVYLWSGPD